MKEYPYVSVDELVRDPSRIVRWGQHRRVACKGGCGRLIWGDYCRKCRRARTRHYKKLYGRR
jgi:hypothetical protein